MEAWLGLRRVAPEGRIDIARDEVLRAGRPGLIDLDGPGRRPAVPTWWSDCAACADEPHFLRAGEEAALGLLDDEDGLAVCTDALRDAQLAGAAAGHACAVSRPGPGPWPSCATTTTPRCSTAETAGDLTVFPWLRDWPRPDVDLMVALEESGFNHVAAPLVRWAREGRDLGVVQEPLADRSAGWALALTSLRDFYASGGSPEAAGGRLRGRGQGARHHDGTHAPGARPGLRAGARAGGRLGRRGRAGHRRVGRRRCSRRRASPTWSSGCASPRPGFRSSAPTATSISAGRPARTRAGW